MKLLVIAVVLCNTLFAQDLKISHLTGNFYIYTTYHEFDGKPFPSNSMYLVTDDGVALFDTPWDESQFQPLLDSIQKRHNKKVVLCIATHFHDDRTAGLAYFKSKGIRTYTSRQTDELSKKHKENRAEFHFKNDTVFALGQHVFRTFYPGEGHAPDNIVILFDNEKIIYGGCFVKSTESPGLGNLSDANVKAWPASIKKLMATFPEPLFIIPGHFGWTDNRSLQHTLKLLEESAKK